MSPEALLFGCLRAGNKRIPCELVYLLIAYS
jgi:hypothetical protein